MLEAKHQDRILKGILINYQRRMIKDHDHLLKLHLKCKRKKVNNPIFIKTKIRNPRLKYLIKHSKNKL